MVYVLLAEGFEETEAIAPTDLLRRAGVETKLVGVTGELVHGSHGIGIQTDLPLDQVDWEKADMVVLPGGMPGTTNLYADERVTNAVRKCYDEGKYVAAICAAPSIILGGMGLLKGRKATCYPGMEDGMTGATPLKRTCVVDGRIITACGVGGALDFGCALVSALCGEEQARQIAAAVVHHVAR
ncbi:DJ-1 family glyoxalase III [Agathobaculum sp. Marseille-P7918]|uniref:DJ-1 family glyoxalase III n=1 Tax=Agathobaculum sp. Marseille-P7918 TaxID=2479843 RepID=UPI000F642BC8|nr:DJ-1 family glyoxalase III [Agathobaculum sp. Marseille-P7918]